MPRNMTHRQQCWTRIYSALDSLDGVDDIRKTKWDECKAHLRAALACLDNEVDEEGEPVEVKGDTTARARAILDSGMSGTQQSHELAKVLASKKERSRPC